MNLDWKMKRIELSTETNKLNRAKIEFAGIKRSYIKDYRSTTIEEVESLD